MSPTPLDGFTVASRTYDGQARDVYRRGEGPAVVVIHEIPGITDAVARFATTVADRGYSVFAPRLFGHVGRPMSTGASLVQIARACVSAEMRVLASDATSPVVSWLRALARDAHAEVGGPGVGVLGMCLTGNFALAMMVDPWVAAPVLSQPSLPFVVSARTRAGLHVSPEDLATVKERTRAGARLLGLRFTDDFMCPRARFDRLRAELGDGFEAIEIDSSPGNPHGIPRTAHSVLTVDLVDEVGHPTRAALDRVLAFFDERLKGSSAPAAP